ncbi:virulence factor BrkB family protein [Psychrobium sp. 1_MG-2023]|uniref:virulence factor BrkB family protein n=1 Tax=Psychrobium sp. 1_MG-2023 TaxID=3062624 RepID=UPI000C31FDE3|nr:virulence factor BrkB family protein [Psychrobium sp. 1_MG-2023]MDP2560387.1 virulence factor BrkB family protein [Psychrobium sp. 1_MG-2023]PKF57944.1 YihY/virulence factor BrkB family protein [Alteromonadales bacterium alter-6D02]
MDNSFSLNKVVSRFSSIPHLLVHIFQRAKQNKLRIVAGYLAYISLLSIVPLLSVVFSVLSAFPVFSSMRTQIEGYVYENFIPAAGDVVQQNIAEFVDNASKMSAISIVALVVVALLLISNIDKMLNQIWRSPRKRPLVISFSIYWMVLTLGPLFLGASIAISSYVLSLGGLEEGVFSGVMSFFLRWLPLFFSVLAFLMVYLMVPNVRVRFLDALVGAIVAALLFELTKKGFALYVSNFPSYQAIYGALAAIPILFVWVYLSWIVVLIGAELTAGLPEFYAGEEAEEPDLVPVLDEHDSAQPSHLTEVEVDAQPISSDKAL